MMDSSLDPIIAKLMDLQKDIQALADSVKNIANGLPASRKAVGIDYTPAETFLSRLSSLGERMKQLESRLMTFDDKELAQKVDQTLFSQSAAGTGLDKSVPRT